jgi:hypothetical protein
MSDINKLDEQAVAARRAFLKKAGKAAVVAPAVAMLLSADVKPAAAIIGPYTQIIYQGPT